MHRFQFVGIRSNNQLTILQDKIINFINIKRLNLILNNKEKKNGSSST